jgi:hypothetical protein
MRPHQRFPIGTKISKNFEDPIRQVIRPYEGIVTTYESLDDEGWRYHVNYPEDGDSEHITEEEVAKHLVIDAEADDAEEKKDESPDYAKKRTAISSNPSPSPKRKKQSTPDSSKKEQKQTNILSFFVAGAKATSTSSTTNKISGTTKPTKLSFQIKRKMNESTKTSTDRVAAASAKSRATSRSNNSKEKDEPHNEEISSSNGRKRSRRAFAQKPNYKVGSSDEEDDEEDFVVPKSKAKQKSTPAKKKKEVILSDDDASFEEDCEDGNLDDDFGDEDDGENITPASRNRRKPAESAKASSSKSKSATTSSSTTKSGDHEFQTKLAKDRKGFRPNNNPQKWPQFGTYVEPVGVDPTHGIVEGIISTQVRKVGGLLKLVETHQENNDKEEIGEINYPIRLQTACSGTDAPSIALGLIKESLDKMSLKQNSDGSKRPEQLFEYTHEMSCEIEPFKQAYIGRNFPGVLLFPDITKLTASEEVLDVYGRPQRIPDGNFFVAGTSCKDFSMLKTRDRKDIEDRGTSGETFLAAVEFLEQKQPSQALFENVDGAPWDKMQEYIRGRIFLPHRNETKAIKDSKKKAGEYHEQSYLSSFNHDFSSQPR